MAKRHKHFEGRGRGGSRGRGRGRGGSRGRGRGGSRSRGAGRGGFGRSSNDDNWRNSSIPFGDGDLGNFNFADIDVPRGRRVYYSPDDIEDYYFGKSENMESMKMGGLRPGHKREDTPRSSSFRARPVQFIKAKDVYDPSHDLIIKLRSKNLEQESQDEELSQGDAESAREDFESGTEEEIEEEEEVLPEIEREEVEEEEVEPEEVEEEEVEPEEVDSEDAESEEVDDKDLFFIDEEGYNEDTLPTVPSVSISEDSTVKKPQKTNLEFNDILTVGKVEINLAHDASDDGVFVSNVKKNYHPFSGYISQVMKNIQVSDEDDDEDDYEDEEEDFQSDFSYKYEQQTTSKAISADIEKLSISSENLKNSSDISRDNSPDNNEEQESKDPEFGFLEEDFVINTSEVSVTNIRIGFSENSYFLKCYRLFGHYESKWIDQETFLDLILNDLGLPEHRLNAYLTFIRDSLIPKEEPPEPTYSDIHFSDTSEEESDNDSEIGDDMREGIEDLISYATKLEKDRNFEFETKSLQTVGKGKKKKLLVQEDMQLDGVIASELQDKFSTRLDNKAKKRRTKEDFIDQENEKSDDLFKKYPYGLHVLNIKEEFELFIRRSDKEALVFPPLDPHGNKTITKFAKFYFMKTNKRGRGNQTHIFVQKVKATRYNEPNYNIIDNLTRQRPIFMRHDVSKPRNEYQRTERVKLPKGKFHVKEGEVVGQDAPVIDRNNIGRILLERLGWSEGEGLGIQGNKGISEPVFAVVKKSKTGLRHERKKRIE
ncbi:hypothetical protein Kpol_1015p2 [Vanderwaltozyma polyspora DSM 70294]|uniref:Protein SQS1 n=1 Tax=Vanderwaltozyma polyspora (strain ATCC 22028 / DSM 70294 / BCRC 21397 / CBS 2163 / NBRC 10782 / NRRL Y-8283 / UCD 57-17) TaxID=436907 RepID=SQS1_VANPO|nr:uncharacterized protein Kpol_1015p2 [Vanderwaltozyma polyspora DSM 70294]A7TQN2.1 RecName: Full=Protein SQS1 [Vanderwaltozyma polyspora DSM 70294]EDO15413.1 hypothetical protein Kpol_1015p2 [Vanderwaltozyma polyspora DSM 70294]